MRARAAGGRRRPARRDRRLRRRRVRLDGPVVARRRRRRRCPAASIARTRTSCGAEREARVLLRRGAGGERRAVERALERRARLVGAERAASRCGSASSAAGPGVDRRRAERWCRGAPKVITSCGRSAALLAAVELLLGVRVLGRRRAPGSRGWRPRRTSPARARSRSTRGSPRRRRRSRPGPVVAGWLAQVTPPSVQGPVTRSAWSVAVPAVEAAYSRSVAVATAQFGRQRRVVEAHQRARVVGRALGHDLQDRVGALVRARRALVDPAVGVRGERSPARRCSPAGSTVHACAAGVASVLPAASVARTRSSCAPRASPL